MTLQSFQLSPEQREVLNKVWRWFNKKISNSNQGFITIGGYAGTGKTTSLAVFREHLLRAKPDLKVAFASYTGKATRVLSQTLKSMGALYKQDFVGTLHSLIYSPVVGGDGSEREVGGVIGNFSQISWERKTKLPYQLIFVDEASMIDRELWRDLRAFEIPIVAVGDHGQLPPIRGNFNLMEKPVLKLETIHRQVADNPIIQLSLEARTTGVIKPGKYGQGVQKFMSDDEGLGEFLDTQFHRFDSEMLVLCGYNHTRLHLNNAIRLALGFENPEPQKGDRVICLKNNHRKDIYNGMLGTLQAIASEDSVWYRAEIAFDDGEGFYSGLISKKQFNARRTLTPSEVIGGSGVEEAGRLKPVRGTSHDLPGDLFDFGYALTVHKAQGSQAKKVILFEERSKHMDDQMWKRWLYTGVTRAQEELYIVGSGN